MARENLYADDKTWLENDHRGSVPFQNNSLIPKVTEFDHAALSQHDVLRFHIPMKNAVRVKVMQSGQQLAGHLLDLGWRERMICHELN